MLFIIYLLLLKNVVICSNVGSTLFNKRHTRIECWSDEDIAKLQARKIFENIIPPSLTPDKVNTEYIKETLKYLRNALKIVDHDVDKNTGALLKLVLADTIGAHLKSEILQSARLAYYAGYIPYRNVRGIHDFFDHIKIFLNTQGIGWQKPRRVTQFSNFTVEKIRVGTGKLIDPCTRLMTKRDSRSCIHIPAPISDDSLRPSAIFLPLKFGGLVNLVSPMSENVLLKYYTTASRCILNNSPDICRHSDFVSFNNELWHWMKREVAPRLLDEKLYAAYGGVLRVAAAVQSYGKGLSRRNLFEYQDAGVSKWHPWKALKESYVYINTDWTPHLYVAVVLMIGIAICLLQICYSYILGDDDVCHCKGKPAQCSDSKDVAYANVDSNIPAMLPSQQSAVYYSDQKRAKIISTSKTKTSSLGSMKTQKVYDLNENTEKLMAVIMSDNETTSDGSATPSHSSHNSRKIIKISHTENLKSPPKIDTSISQIKIERKRSKNQSQTPMYSTSTITNSEVTYQEAHVTDSLSGTGTSTSERTASSTSSKSRCRRSRSSRDLAWARHVVSMHSLRKNTSGTEQDVTSYTTPKSNR